MSEKKVGCAPDGYMPIPTAEQLAEALENVRSFHEMSAELIAPELLANLLAAPTVKAEQPDCVYCQGHGEVTRTSGQTAESYAEHNEECPECKGTGLSPSLPAAGSAGEEVRVVGYQSSSGHLHLPDSVVYPEFYNQLMTVAQHNRIVAALSAQQSAPERVSVPGELAARLQRFCQRPHSSRDEADALDMELRALLASHGRGEA